MRQKVHPMRVQVHRQQSIIQKFLFSTCKLQMLIFGILFRFGSCILLFIPNFNIILDPPALYSFFKSYFGFSNYINFPFVGGKKSLLHHINRLHLDPRNLTRSVFCSVNIFQAIEIESLIYSASLFRPQLAQWPLTRAAAYRSAQPDDLLTTETPAHCMDASAST